MSMRFKNRILAVGLASVVSAAFVVMLGAEEPAVGRKVVIISLDRAE